MLIFGRKFYNVEYRMDPADIFTLLLQYAEQIIIPNKGSPDIFGDFWRQKIRRAFFYYYF